RKSSYPIFSCITLLWTSYGSYKLSLDSRSSEAEDTPRSYRLSETPAYHDADTDSAHGQSPTHREVSVRFFVVRLYRYRLYHVTRQRRSVSSHANDPATTHLESKRQERRAPCSHTLAGGARSPHGLWLSV